MLSDMEWLRLAPQEVHVKWNIYSVRSTVHTASPRGVKGSFQMAGQWGSALPNFCNFPKLPNQQPSLLFTVAGQVHIGEKWADCFFHCPLSLMNHTVHVCAATQSCIKSLLAQLACNTNQGIQIPVCYLWIYFFCSPFSGFLLTTVSALSYSITVMTSILPHLKGKSLYNSMSMFFLTWQMTRHLALF